MQHRGRATAVDQQGSLLGERLWKAEARNGPRRTARRESRASPKDKQAEPGSRENPECERQRPGLVQDRTAGH